MQCIVKVCGSSDGKLVGCVFWSGGYHPFATFDWHKDPLVKDSDVVHPEVLGSYMQIEFSDVTTDLQAYDPIWVCDVDELFDDEEKALGLDLSIYEAWLRSKSIDIPNPIDPKSFNKTMKSEKNRGYFKLAKQQIQTI